MLLKPDLKRTAVCNRPIFRRCHENEASVYGVRRGLFRPLRFTVQLSIFPQLHRPIQDFPADHQMALGI